MAREADQRGFRRRVMNADDIHVGAPGDGGHVHDRAGPRGAHGGAEQARRVEAARQVDADDAAPLLGRHLPDGVGAPLMLRGHAGVVHQDVEGAAERLLSRPQAASKAG